MDDAKADQEADRLFKEAAVDAIRKIAAGHNDPRGLATAVVIQFDASRLVRPGPSAP